MSDMKNAIVKAVQAVKAELLWDLRQKILRPDQALEASKYPDDDEPRAIHYAVFDGDQVVASASVFPAPRPGTSDPGSWRLRGMATTLEVRGTGCGSRVLVACIEEARRRGATTIWCHARTPAAEFYRRHGFTVESDGYEMAGIGPHVLMQRVL